MASVGNSVRMAIKDWESGEMESAMLHACNAVDGTAKKTYPNLGSNARFTRLIRDNYGIFGPMGLPGVNVTETRWDVVVERPKASGGMPDIADVVYGVHRCSHGHGEELPDGFELIADAAGPKMLTHLHIERGKVRLSDRVIFALLAVTVFSKENLGQVVPDGYYLSYEGMIMPINEWWGRAEDFLAIAAAQNIPSVILDFKNWR